MTGDIIDAREAERLGLVNRVVSGQDLMPAAVDLAKGPALAISWTKMAINKRIRADMELILDTSLAWEHHTARGEDAKEARAAFIEKHEPVFEGR